ncbi:MAG TPA: hypothetical protein VNX18_03620 [Bryobacteraceae bacterium]|jgi:DNA-directed RNA polymerase specialized sigma24 family protein|nr:hypothetical protein [Bryobacteraceae bacterium]
MLLIRSADECATEQLYNALSVKLRPYFFKLIGRPDANARFHDTFIETIDTIRRGELREPEAILRFATTIARRQVFTHIRAAVWKRTQLASNRTTNFIIDDHDNPEKAIITWDCLEFAKSTLAALSEPEREVVARFYLDEQGEEQICREMVLTKTQFAY